MVNTRNAASSTPSNRASFRARPNLGYCRLKAGGATLLVGHLPGLRWGGVRRCHCMLPIDGEERGRLTGSLNVMLRVRRRWHLRGVRGILANLLANFTNDFSEGPNVRRWGCLVKEQEKVHLALEVMPRRSGLASTNFARPTSHKAATNKKATTGGGGRLRLAP